MNLEREFLITLEPYVPDSVKSDFYLKVEEFKRDPDAFQIAFNGFLQTQHDAAKFFFLGIVDEFLLHRYLEIPPDHINRLRSELMTWAAQQEKSEGYVVKKVALILVRVLKQEYPHNWPNVFADLFSLPSPYFFFSVMKCLDEEIVNRDVHRNMQELAHNTGMKDLMRRDFIPGMVERVVMALTSDSLTPALKKYCLEAFQPYISWIDISLTANPDFLQLLSSALSVPHLAVPAIDCIFSIAAKGSFLQLTSGMEPSQKISLLSNLRFLDLFATTQQSNDMYYQAKAVKGLNTVGLALLAALSGLTDSPDMEAGTQMLYRALDFAFAVLNRTGFEIGHEVIPFLHQYVSLLKSRGELSEVEGGHVGAMLQCCQVVLKYPQGYSHITKDELELTFDSFRGDVELVFKNIVRMNQDGCFNYVLENLTNATQASASWEDFEVWIYLFWAMGEPLNGDFLRAHQELIPQQVGQMVMLLTNTVPATAEPLLLFTFHDTIARYAKFLPLLPDQLIHVLQAFLDNRGFRSEDAFVRKRAADRFRSFVQTQEVKSGLLPFLAEIADALSEWLLTSPHQQVHFDSQVHVYESMGSLIGSEHNAARKCSNSAELQLAYLERILRPLVSQLQEIVQARLYRQDTPENQYFTILIVQRIQAISVFSKGNHTQNIRASQKDSRNIAPYMDVLAVLLALITDFPEHEVIREKTFVFLHTMVECIGRALVEPARAMLPPLLLHSRPKDVQDVVKLVAQLARQFGPAAYDLVNEQFQPVVNRLFELFSTKDVTPQSEEEREKIDLQASYYQLLWSLASAKLGHVLVSAENVGNIANILGTLVAGIDSPNDTIQKNALQTIKALTEQYLDDGVDPAVSQNFLEFLYSSFLPALFQAALQRIDFNSPRTAHFVLGDIYKLQELCFDRRGPEFVSFMQQFLPALGVVQPEIDTWLTLLHSHERDKFFNFFKTFCLSRRPQ